MLKVKKLRNAIGAVLLCMVFSFAFMGCGKTLEKQMKEDTKVQEDVEEFRVLLGENVTSEVKKNEIVYTIQLEATFGEEEIENMKPALEKAVEQTKDIYEKSIEAIEEETEIKDISITIVYLNGDGKEILRYTYKV